MKELHLKKLQIIFLFAFMTLLVACGETNTQTETEVETNTELEATNTATTDVSQEFGDDLSVLVEQYMALKDALVASDLEEARTQAEELDVDMKAVNWQLIIDRDEPGATVKEKLAAYLNSVEIAQDLESMRKAFSGLSNEMASLLRSYDLEDDLYLQYCPMAFDNTGAYWISDVEEISNPYFGDKMLRCGRTEEQL